MVKKTLENFSMYSFSLRKLFDEKIHQKLRRKIKILVGLLVQQGHYWSYLRAEPFCAGFGGFSVWGKLVGYPISCHVIFPLQRYVISGRLYLEGDFLRGQYFTLGDIEEEKPGVWGIE